MDQEIVMVRECVVRYSGRRQALPAALNNPAAVERWVRGTLHVDDVHERIVALALNAEYRPLGWYTVAVGDVASSLAHVAPVLRFALIAGGTAIIVAHNHPSGCLEPSAADIAYTQRLRTAAATVGLAVLDHVILSDRGTYSFLEHGLILRTAP